MRRTSIDREISNRRKRNKKKNGKVKNFLFMICILGIICCYTGLFLLYGPWYGFRDWLITSAMTTMTHQYLATWFYDEATINDCLNRNKIVEVADATDADAIHFVDYSNQKNITYANEYEREILQKDPNNNDYKIIRINGDDYDGYMAVIYDPSRIHVAATTYLGTSGQYLTSMSEANNASVAINAGGFVDENYEGSGGTPLGITISNNKYLTTFAYAGSGGLIGFNKDNKLILGKYSANQAESLGIRDGVTFGPFLIVNGKASEISGNGGWGKAPRTAIAQRQDGIVLFLVLDGNRTLGKGAGMDDLVEILQRYGAYNAANLDGGTSTSMTVKHRIVNDPTTMSGTHRTRPVATAFYLKSDSSDNGDYSVVKNKVDK